MSHSHPHTPNPSRSWQVLSSLVMGAGIATAGSFLAWSPESPLRQENQVAVAQTAPATPAIAPTANPNFITDVVTDVGPAVVRIDASRTVSQRIPDVFNDPTFRQFFGGRLPQGSQERTERGLGSGFIISDDGKIITNAHVVDGADTVTVTLKDGRILDGRVLGSDPVTDIAVIKVDERNLPTVPLGNSDQLQPGEWSIAIGNPLGLDNTVTVGIVSAVGRSSNQVGVPDKRVEFIQTDTAINPGNSGGPLLNQQGEVIGVNTAIINGAQGLGFAIPINMVERIATELADTGEVQHPFLGIQMITLSPDVKEDINANPNSGLTVEEDTGILIARVLSDSPAASSGLRAGDVITAIDGQAVDESAEVQRIVSNGKVGQQLTLEVKRNGAVRTINVKPENLPQ
ncbi:PDZ domain-containing protein [Leptolyngbyaceae cyanobacterium CCMR0082]|uniref:PDZ domain-containing protein n=2 Tax=Adonisia turfae TaxID=2950184 RepID=A0A6M0S221_9CYAN|nr:HhoA/HhoB/HtrA family serine endopeptidase [Adonisia turfae]MDV3347679.1 HhoA/HhoB/HtrA family serine endopeptidase [Leptothoe sp. LEGE 181152]NEZ60657.1 PDZ domain-containing protein [Adonisia turfae CCMR0081]NEZ62300.1 PDZ domain-containing protein [Adonisia turfae CCMR0082]